MKLDIKTHNALVLLAISLLRSGNTNVQSALFQLLSKGGNERVFERMNMRLQEAIASIELNTSSLASCSEKCIQVLEVMRLMCEGSVDILSFFCASITLNYVQDIIYLYRIYCASRVARCLLI